MSLGLSETRYYCLGERGPSKGIFMITLAVPCISEGCIEIKIKLSFYFHTSLWCLKGLKAFIKPFEAPQRSVKVKV